LDNDQIFQAKLMNNNDVIKVNKAGIYELLSVEDKSCPGTVDPLAATFEVQWLPRPQIKFADTAVLLPSGKGGEHYAKRDVCEGDHDVVEISLIGKLLLCLAIFVVLISCRLFSISCQIPSDS